MAASARISVLPPPPSGGGGKVMAIGPTDREATFVALIEGIGFRYLDLAAEPPGRWSTAGGFAGSVTGAFGLHHRHGTGAAAFVSFVESPARSWVCLRVPQAGEAMSVDEAALVERTALPAEVVAVGGAGEEAVLVLTSGVVRFMDLTTGKAAGKSLKLEPPQAATNGAAGGGVAVCCLGPRRAAVVRQGGEFFIVELDMEQRRAVLRLHGTLGGGAGPLPSGSLLGVAAAGEAGEKDRVLLCWGSPRSKKAASAPSASPHRFATALLDGPAPGVRELPALSGASAAAAATGEDASRSAVWLCIGGYVAEWTKAGDEKTLALTVRDARFGMHVASDEVPLASDKPAAGGGQWLACTAGDTTLLVGGSRGAEVAAIRWALPPFSLQLVVGASEKKALASAAAAAAAASGPLAALHEAASGKRSMEDAAVEELFSAKRRKGTDEALAAEVRARACAASEELVDLVTRRRCWTAARALLALPELDEALATRLLAADAGGGGAESAGLLAPAVRRPSTPRLLEVALADHLPASALPGVLEVLLEWLDAYRDFPSSEVEAAAPGIPSQGDIVRFLSALADGCLPSLLRLDGDLLERVVEALSLVSRERARTERLHAAVRVAARLGAEGREQKAGEAAAVEVVLVDF